MMKNMKLLPLFLLLIWMMTGCSDAPGNPAASAATEARVVPGPAWAENAVLYECNVRQFSPEGNFAGVASQLQRLKDLGIDILWLMPIHPIGEKNRKEHPGDLGSPYSVRDYYAVNPDFGSLADFKNLVSRAHQTGLKVIMDWVPNHTAWDAVWMQEHPDYYTRINGQFTTPLNEHGAPTDWDDCADLNYDNPELRKAMIEAMQYWIREADIDGYRVDMAGLVPNDFWAQVRPALDSIKQVFMLGEWQDEPAHFTSCFNANYGWKWKDVTKNIAAGRQDARALDSLLQYLNGFYPPGYVQVYFTQNHDENSWTGTETGLYGDAADAFNVLMFTWQGMPMLYNGQEDAMNQRLAFFKKDPILWNQYIKTPFYQNLCDLKHRNKALRSGKNGGAVEKIPTNKDGQVYAFTREKEGARVVVVLNLGKTPCTVTLNPDTRTVGSYLNLFGASTIQVTKEMQMNLKPWDYIVLTNQ